MAILAIKIAASGAFAVGNENILISEVFSSGRDIPVEAFRQRLEDLYDTMPFGAVRVAGQHVPPSADRQALLACVAAFAAERSIPWNEVPMARYRSAFTGYARCSGEDVLVEALRLKLGARTVAEAEAIAVYHCALDRFPPRMRAA